MENGVERGENATGATGKRARAIAKDAFGAILTAESTIAQRVVAVGIPLGSGAGDAVAFEAFADSDQVTAQVTRLMGWAEEGERVALVAPSHALAAARVALRTMATKRLPAVFHALADHGYEGAFALADLGWGVLFASGALDSIDLSLVARRAAEDSGTPFLIVHERSAVRRLEPVVPPDSELCEAFLGPPLGRMRKIADPAHPIHAKIAERAFAERVPFAIGSAMRGLEAFTGRRHDTIEWSPMDGAAVMLVAAGALGEAVLGEAARLRASGKDVGAVKLTALRPFPGPRLIRALARAHVVTVLEATDEPLAQSNPLTREVKAAFADALTWAPDYPGIGRLPRIHSGVVGIGGHELESGDLDAIVRNMTDGEQGKRHFAVGPQSGLAPAPSAAVAPGPATSASMRGRVADFETASACAELCATVIASALALKCRVSVRPSAGVEGEGAAFDLDAARERPRGASVPLSVGLVAFDDPGALVAGNPLARVVHGSIVAIPTSQETAAGFWAEMPAYVKAIAFDRGVRIVGFPTIPEGDDLDRRWMIAAAFAGVALLSIAGGSVHLGRSSRAAVDGRLVEREVIATLRAFGADAARAEKAGHVARVAFEAKLEVPRETIERDLASVRLGRRDARAGALEG
jgi:pyruvate/2-oxoacid:ferredoxin oxidoreductase alpha subunit